MGLPQKIMMIKRRVNRTISTTSGQGSRVGNSSVLRELLYLTWRMTWRNFLRIQPSPILVIQRNLTSFLILKTITKNRKLLTLLNTLFPKINWATMLSSVYRLDRNSNRKPKTLLKITSYKLKKVMTLITLFLTVFGEATLQSKNVNPSI